MVNEAGEILECFDPQLDEVHEQYFATLVQMIGNAFPNYRNQLVQNELKAFENNEDNLEAVKYVATLNVLIDLCQQGWKLEVHENQLYLKMAAPETVDKEYIRYRLSSERKAQFQEPSVQHFVEKMEAEKNFNGAQISIRNLIGDTQQLISRIQDNVEPIVHPYIQLVEHKKDEHTGYWLSDIWRYFRYTWSIPYKTMPGRNLFYLVRDAAQEYHPIIGIFALGNSVLNLTVRDDDIGWTVEAIAKRLKRMERIDRSSQTVSGTNGKTVGATTRKFLETEEEYEKRLQHYSADTMDIIQRNLLTAISELYLDDLDYQLGQPVTAEKIEDLRLLAEKLRKQSIDNKKTAHVTSYIQEAQEILFKKKRASELSRLLDAQLTFEKYHSENTSVWLTELMHAEDGRKAVNVALVANRKTKIGSNMMEIIVCGAIPPYNELLGGKLISILACSPTVIRDYTVRYQNQVSEIASRMKGAKVIRDNQLAFLGTTSLYAVGSSQYNRIKVPITDDFSIQYRKMGITEGYGTVYFSKNTTSSLMRVLELQDGGRRINNIFGEGTSPRFRLISRGLSSLGIKADAFLKHYSPRIVYSINLAKNTSAFLCGATNVLEYPFNIKEPLDVSEKTNQMIDYWYTRWLRTRIGTVDIIDRLTSFDVEDVLVSKMR